MFDEVLGFKSHVEFTLISLKKKNGDLIHPSLRMILSLFQRFPKVDLLHILALDSEREALLGHWG